MDAAAILRTALPVAAPAINLASGSTPPIDPQLLMTTDDICRSNGYRCEVHPVSTEDGYELTMHRILPSAPFRAAILVMSGLIGCSDNFFAFGKNNSLPFMLADAGYDVFLGNQRGCAYSRGHKKWTRRDPQYWRYTLDDVALFDMPALVSLAQRLSGERRLFYVGYSAGTHSLYAFLQLRPDLRPSLRAAFLLGPAVLFTRHHNPLIRALASFPDRTLREMGKNAGELMGRTRSFVQLVWQTCRDDAPPLLKRGCRSFSKMFFGLTANKTKGVNEPFTMAHSFCGTSTMASAHYIQMMKSRKLEGFDWGPKENFRRYGSEKPPEYQLQNITLPIASFVGRNDRYVSLEDAQLLSRKSSRNLGVFVMPPGGWDHFDYVANTQAPRLIYDRILGMMAGL
ncbi:lipase member M-like [Schistocerca gregaria]|uniref:lipase member M-like n=1 Tax=Schistocerca gregaria TaxID=7010 RepID=UPI00211EB33C|nr:lipase member M-like [Schistocerca gregaria]